MGGGGGGGGSCTFVPTAYVPGCAGVDALLVDYIDRLAMAPGPRRLASYDVPHNRIINTNST